MLRIGDVPRRINVHFGALTGHPRISEIGEPAVGPVPPAVAMPSSRLPESGLRSMPFRLHDLKWT